MVRPKTPLSGVDPARITALASLTVDEARKQLYGLARRFFGLQRPSRSLLDRALAVGPYRKGGLVILPEIDARAALERLDAAERENAELLDELEDLGILLLAQERLADPTPVDQLIPLEELARSVGREHLVAD